MPGRQALSGCPPAPEKWKNAGGAKLHWTAGSGTNQRRGYSKLAHRCGPAVSAAAAHRPQGSWGWRVRKILTRRQNEDHGEPRRPCACCPPVGVHTVSVALRGPRSASVLKSCRAATGNGRRCDPLARSATSSANLPASRCSNAESQAYRRQYILAAPWASRARPVLFDRTKDFEHR